MITREEYNKALDIVEEYQKQLFLINDLTPKEFSKTKLKDWEKLVKCSTRLYNILMGRHENPEQRERIQNMYVEDFTKRTFKRFRYAGQSSWTEFQELRGY